MEANILKTLSFRVTLPTSFTFLVRFLKAAHADREIALQANYILDKTLQSIALLRYLPSQLAAASVFIARQVNGRHAWSPTLLKEALYTEEEISPVAKAIQYTQLSLSSEYDAVDKKYRRVPLSCCSDAKTCDFYEI